MIEAYQLRYFLAVVEEGGFTAAARRVNVTQPTLSAGIAKLERSLNAQLFERSARRIALTPAGDRFLPRARNMLQEYMLALAEISDSPEPRARVRLGVLATLSVRRMARMVRLLDQQPGLELSDGGPAELLARLDQGRLDAALLLLRKGETRPHQVIATESYVLALSESHRFAGQPHIRAQQLAGEPMIIRRRCEVLPQVSRHFTNAGVRPPLVYRTISDANALALVAAGHGITVIPESHAEAGIATAKLTGFGARRTIALVYGNSAASRAAENDRTRLAEAARTAWM